MKKIILLASFFVAYLSTAQVVPQKMSFDFASIVCAGDGNGNCDPNNSNIPFAGTVEVTPGPGSDEFTISDITGGLYEQGYGEEDNPAVVVMDAGTMTLAVVNQPDVVFGGDVFNGTGTYTVDGNGRLDTFEIEWSNGWGDAGENVYTFGALSNNDFNVSADFNYYISNGNLTIESVNTIGDVQIYNLAGQLIENDATTSNEKVVDISGYTTGIYIAIVNSNDKETTFKFVKR